MKGRTADITQRAQVATDEILASEEPVVPVIESAPIPEGIPTPEGGGYQLLSATSSCRKECCYQGRGRQAARWELQREVVFIKCCRAVH